VVTQKRAIECSEAFRVSAEVRPFALLLLTSPSSVTGFTRSMAATVQSALRSSHSHYHQHNPPAVLTPSQHHQHQQQQRRNASSKQRFLAEFSQCLVDFVIQLLPTVEELAVKEDVRKLLERLIRTIEPDSRLLSFGSTANGFSLRNSGRSFCST
jgi:DNA polymerase sigma